MSQPEDYRQALSSYLQIVSTTPPSVLAELTRIFDRRAHAQSCGRSTAAELSYIADDSATAHAWRRRQEYRRSVNDHRLSQDEATILFSNWEQGFAAKWGEIA